MKFTVKKLAPRLEGFAVAAFQDEHLTDLGVRENDHVLVVNDDREPVIVSVCSTDELDDDERIVALDEATRDHLDVDDGDTVVVDSVDVPETHRASVAVVGGPPEDAVVEAELRDRLYDRAVRTEQSFTIPLSTGPRESVTVSVVDSSADDLAVLREHATIEFVDYDEYHDEETDDGVTYADIGGIDEAVWQVQEVVEAPLARPEVFDHLGTDPPSGVILYGPPGTGKTLLARAVANEVDAYFESIEGPEVFSKWFGESEANVREVFERAERNAPSVVFVDELDAIAGKRDGEKRPEDGVVTQLLTLLDGLDDRSDVMVVGATNRVDDIDRALRRPGRFDREIEVGPPDRDGRREILEIHTDGIPLGDDVDLDVLARRTVGFTGADLAALVNEAAQATRRRSDVDDAVDVELAVADLQVTAADFQAVLPSIEPSAMREYRSAIPEVGWDDVGGHEEAKALLERAVVWPSQHDALFEEFGLSPPSGVLLYGPPGTGKTRIAKAVANEANATFLSVKGPELLGGSPGHSAENVREVFERARENAPCVVFFDEVDALAAARGSTFASGQDSVVGQLLTELDGMAGNEGVFVLAATNRPRMLDEALVRPGRFEKAVAVDLPDQAARRDILDIHTRGMPLATDVDLDAIARKADGYSGADLEAVCREASFAAVGEVVEEASESTAGAVSQAHLLEALDAVEPSVDQPGAGTLGDSEGHAPMFS